MLTWLIVLGVVSGFVSVYGGMASMAYTSVMQFVLIFGSGFVLFILAYNMLPNGWSDVVKNDPSGFHLIKPMDYPEIPWHAIVLSLLGLQLYYSCINQSMVQRGFGGKTEWDVRIAIIAAGFAVLFRPFVEVFPGIMSRALVASGFDNFAPQLIAAKDGTMVPDYDSLLPKLINNLVKPGFIGLMIVGILSSVMSTISALLGSIATLFTFDVYKRWIKPDANDKQLVRVGVLSTLVLMVFGILYSPMIGRMGGIFTYFQTVAAYIAAPIATVYLFGMFWKRTTPNAALAIMVGGIPLGIAIHYFIGWKFSEETIKSYSLNNQFVEAGISQIVCAVLIIVISLVEGSKAAFAGQVSSAGVLALEAQHKPIERDAEIESLMWKWEYLWLPKDEPKRPFFQSVLFWWGMFMLVSCSVVVYLW
jgi:SSS family solute:Na+ symporter